MAYNNDRDIYSCDICGFESKWEAKDDAHGELWSCEKCGRIFCTKCFTDRFGNDEYLEMINNADQVHCPDCWEKRKEDD